MDKAENDLKKWAFLKAAPFADANHPKIRGMGEVIRLLAGRNPMRYAQICATIARDWISYVRDTDRTGAEDIAGYTREPNPNDAIEALNRGADDCDAKSRLFCALLLVGNIRARMMALWEDQGQGVLRLVHVYAAAELGGQWYPFETTLARARLGDEPKSIPREESGKWLHT